jgi:hypothetical protein
MFLNNLPPTYYWITPHSYKDFAVYLLQLNQIKKTKHEKNQSIGATLTKSLFIIPVTEKTPQVFTLN